jgi:hypothetical protein
LFELAALTHWAKRFYKHHKARIIQISAVTALNYYFIQPRRALFLRYQRHYRVALMHASRIYNHFNRAANPEGYNPDPSARSNTLGQAVSRLGANGVIFLIF